MRMVKEARTTTSSFTTKSSLLIASAETAVPRVRIPVLLTSELPGRASMRALAFAFGSCCWLEGVEEEDEANLRLAVAVGV